MTTQEEGCLQVRDGSGRHIKSFPAGTTRSEAESYVSFKESEFISAITKSDMGRWRNLKRKAEKIELHMNKSIAKRLSIEDALGAKGTDMLDSLIAEIAAL